MPPALCEQLEVSLNQRRTLPLFRNVRGNLRTPIGIILEIVLMHSYLGTGPEASTVINKERIANLSGVSKGIDPCGQGNSAYWSMPRPWAFGKYFLI
jgi:hypothetical protein